MSKNTGWKEMTDLMIDVLGAIGILLGFSGIMYLWFKIWRE